MDEAVCDTVDTMLASVQDEVNDPQLTYKLRTARQLLVACKDENEMYKHTLETVDLDEETAEQLRRLGYLD